MDAAGRAPGPSSGPFYDKEFVADYNRGKLIGRWTCDRCGASTNLPSIEKRLKEGWRQLDFTVNGRDKQTLCPLDVTNLARWFRS